MEHKISKERENLVIEIKCKSQFEIDKIHQAIGDLPSTMTHDLYCELSKYISEKQKDYYESEGLFY